MQNHLIDQGYDLIAYPKTTIAPLQLLILRGNDLTPLNDTELSMLFEPDVKPKPTKRQQTANISGKKGFTSDLKTDLGALSQLFQFLGLNDSELKLKAERNTNLQVSFLYENVVEEMVGELDLDNFLTGAIPVEGAFRTNEERLRNSELYVITNVLRSSRFNIQLTDDKGVDVGLNASIKPFAEGKLTVAHHQNEGMTLEHTGSDSLAFAFKAVRVLCDKPDWWQFWKSGDAQFRIKNQQGHTMRGGEEKFPVLPLGAGHRWVDL